MPIKLFKKLFTFRNLFLLIRRLIRKLRIRIPEAETVVQFTSIFKLDFEKAHEAFKKLEGERFKLIKEVFRKLTKGKSDEEKIKLFLEKKEKLGELEGSGLLFKTASQILQTVSKEELKEFEADFLIMSEIAHLKLSQ